MSSVMKENVLGEFLELYKSFNCLWDQSSKMYGNRPARDMALEVLADKLREIDKDANIASVRKKLENLRTAYRRERRKVMEMKKSGEGPYVPKLWYYEYLSFLDDDNSEDLTDSTCEDEGNDLGLQPPSKKRRAKTSFKQEPNDNSLASENVVICRPEVLLNTFDNAPLTSLPTAESDSSLYYGQAVGHQLKDMSNLQRCIAEKLISEVVFHGKLGKLTIDSAISLNN